MIDPGDIEDIEEATGLTYEEVMRILEDEMDNYEEDYSPLDFNDDYRSL